MLADAERRPFSTAESRSGSKFEQVSIDGETFVVKYVHLDDDFTMRASGDVGCRTVRAYAAGLYDVASDVIDHAVVAAALGYGRNGTGGALMMRDVTPLLVAPGDDPLSEADHAAFLDHVTAMCARTWGWHDDFGLMPYPARWGLASFAAVECERTLGWPEAVPEIMDRGWQQFVARAPADVADVIKLLCRDQSPLSAALSSTPSCFLHGDWKVSNLGRGPDDRTVLLDWAYVGEGPACHELGWYLALNRAKIPGNQSKETVIADFRAGLERRGVDTGAWWDRQLSLSLLGTLVQFGWEKAFGDDAELGWWCDRAREGASQL